jgi:putative SOS response-associated peptidase YedK
LGRDGALLWLHGGLGNAAELDASQIREDDFVAVPVSTKVNSTRYDEASLIEPVTPLPVQQGLF